MNIDVAKEYDLLLDLFKNHKPDTVRTGNRSTCRVSSRSNECSNPRFRHARVQIQPGYTSVGCVFFARGGGRGGGAKHEDYDGCSACARSSVIRYDEMNSRKESVCHVEKCCAAPWCWHTCDVFINKIYIKILGTSV